MKTLRWITGLLLIMLFAGNQVLAQESVTNDKKQEKLTRAEKKQLKEETEKANWEKIVDMAKKKQFVFEANYFYTPNGNTTVNSSTNFFSVDGDNAVIQISFTNLEGVPTPNNVGGITAKCTVIKYTYEADDYKKPVTIRVSAKPLAGQGTGVYQLDLSIYSDGSGDMQMGRYNLRMNGMLRSLENSKVFQGNTR
jgi:hypothetical protein